MLGHFGLPVGQARPVSAFPDFIWGPKQGAGVSNRSPTDGTTVQDSYVSEEAHVEEPAKRQVRAPEPAMDGPTGTRQVLRCPAAAHLHDRDLVALLNQSMRGDAAAEAGADDNEVEIVSVSLARHGGPLGFRGDNGDCKDESTGQYLTCWVRLHEQARKIRRGSQI